MLKRYGDLLAGIVLFLLAAALYVGAQHVKTLAVSSIGSGFFPAIVAVILAIDSLVIIGEGLARARRPVAAAKTAQEHRPRSGAVLATFVIMALYAGLLPVLGFMISTTLYLFAQMLLMAEPGRRRPFLFAGASLATAVIVYYVFIEVFHLMLPHGILG